MMEIVLCLLAGIVAILIGLIVLIARDMIRYKRETTKRLDHIVTLIKRNGT